MFIMKPDSWNLQEFQCVQDKTTGLSWTHGLPQMKNCHSESSEMALHCLRNIGCIN